MLLARFGGQDVPDPSTAEGGLLLENLVVGYHVELLEESFGHNFTAADEATVTAFYEDRCLPAVTPSAPTTAAVTTGPPTTLLPAYDLSVPSTCGIGAVLQLGDTGDDVRCLQLRLDQITPTSVVTVDGVFSAETDSHVRLFQTVNNMTVDGIVGEQTAGLLDIWSPPAAPPAVQPIVGQTDVYYENCDAVRAAGADPIRRGDPGYRPGLDRDGDGVGCE